MKIDFFCIGAQKSGTTSLFHYLKEHPKINLPANKEAPYFYKRYKDSNLEDYFQRSFKISREKGIKTGTINPHYMCFPGAAKEIYHYNPSAKILVTLRDPVERLISHVKMCLRKGVRLKDYDQLLNALLKTKELEKARSITYADHFNLTDQGAQFLIAWGEYGRIMKYYYRFFPKKQILIISSD
ncbi:sulfotransferase domain-containing protein, partial [Xanthovirga aplysinae]|uniref:sulfotransferase domain-containing protein n=1 Tax=Xanthovirga aplysinae TaxID=2529853 RepID=UPI0016571F97